MTNWINKILGRKDKHGIANTIDPILPDLAPDYPCPFGCKTAWYAIKNETPLSVIEKLRLDIVCESNWKFGLAHIHKNDDVFVSPQIGDYVLVIDLIGITRNADHEMVKQHSVLFSELQYFGSHRIVDYYAWAKFTKGNLLRAYAYIGEGGELHWNEGQLTAEELTLGFDKFPVSDDLWNEEDIFPDEENVIAMAKAWGVDPTFSHMICDQSTGYICHFKDR